MAQQLQNKGLFRTREEIMNYKKHSYFNVLLLLVVSLVTGLGITIFSEKPQNYATEALVEKILREESSLLDGRLNADFVPYLVSVAKDHELDPLLVLAVMKVESSFKPDAKSRAGALGLLQLKPIAAKEVTKVFATRWYGPRHLMNPFVNVKIGIQYLAHLKNLVGKDKIRILSAYNLGPTHVKRLQSHSTKYARKVLKAYTQFLKKYS